jgi:hypothetical protein
MQVVGMVGNFQSSPKQIHLAAVKREPEMTYGLWYPKNQNFQLTSYSYVDWENWTRERAPVEVHSS